MRRGVEPAASQPGAAPHALSAAAEPDDAMEPPPRRDGPGRETAELAAATLLVCGAIGGGSYYIAHIFFEVKQRPPTKPGEEDHNVAAGKRVEQYVKLGFTLAFMLLMVCFFWCVCRDWCNRKWRMMRHVRSHLRLSAQDELAMQRMLHQE